MRCAAFNTGPEFHMLDHIAPLAAWLKMPLILTEEQNFELACRFYPQVEVRWIPDLEFRFREIAEEFDALFECKHWSPHLKSLFKQFYKKEMCLVYCPHGQSDKGYRSPILAQHMLQDIVLVYGNLMLDMLKELNIPLSRYALVGNYRLAFYQKHKPFYDAMVSLPRDKPTLLYAPTWKDADQSTSFFTYGAKVLSELPSDWNLILKLHPLLEQRDPAQFYKIAKFADKKKNIFVYHDFPPVYPLLSIADAYLGDFSSVGYDYLAFQRPLFFFPTDHPGRLHSCGKTIDPSQNLYTQIETTHTFHAKQKELYQFAFSPVLPEKINKQIFSL